MAGARLRIALIVCSSIILLAPAVHAQNIEWETLNDEVKSLHEQGRYERAVVVAKKALYVAERSFGPDHPNVAKSLNNLSLLYDAMGKTEEAREFAARAEAIRKINR